MKTNPSSQAIGSKKSSFEEFHDIFNALDEGFSYWDEDWNFVTCNEKYIDFIVGYKQQPFEVGLSAEEAIRRTFRYSSLTIPPEMNEDDYVKFMADWIGGSSEPLELEDKLGRIIIVSRKPTARGGVLLTLRDVTEERNSEQKAREMLYDAIESLEEGFSLWDADFRLLMCNDKYMEIIIPYRDKALEIGISGTEAITEAYHSGLYVIPEGVTEKEYVEDWMAWASSHSGPLEVPRTDGRINMVSAKPTKLGGVLITAVDVTEERKNEQKAREVLYDAVESLSNAIVLYDAEMDYVMSNTLHDEFWFKGSGIPYARPGENLKSVMQRLLEADYLILPEDKLADEYFDMVFAAVLRFEKGIIIESKGGTILANVIQTGLGGHLIEMSNITEQLALEAELEKQRETAHQNEKLSALGELLAGVAHELNNPLSVVFGYSQMLQGKFDDPVINKRVDMIGQSAERAAKIVKTFLAMARQRPTKIEVCSINKAIETALEVSSYGLLANGTRVIQKLDDSIPCIKGDFDQLAQVFTNLIVNAGHALAPLREEGELSIRSSYEKASNQVIIEICDNGPGIPEDIQHRIFEPFFTTKDVGKGTGVGLAFSHRIINSHKGRLYLESAVTEGTMFVIELEATKETSAELSLDDNKLHRLELEHVLVIDDEEGVAQFVSDILNENGVSTTTMSSPRKALELLQVRNFDAIVSDYKMPDMTGEQLYEAIQVLSPSMANKMGFITGDSMSSDVRSFFDKTQRPFIEKPIIVNELMFLLDSLMEENSDAS